MTTLKEDQHSWKASSIMRRDFRSAKDEPEVPRHRRRRGGTTKKWCRGKIGRPHKPANELVKSYAYEIVVCEACGKHLEYRWTRRWAW